MITSLQGLKCIWTPCISGLLSVWSSVVFRCIHSRIVLFFYLVESDVNRNLASYCPATALSTIYLVWQAEIKWMFSFFPLLRYIYIYIYILKILNKSKIVITSTSLSHFSQWFIVQDRSECSSLYQTGIYCLTISLA